LFNSTIVVVYNFYAGKDIPEDADIERLMLNTGADNVLNKVSWFFF